MTRQQMVTVFEKARLPCAMVFFFLYIAACYVLPVQFGENDDAVMMALASGQYSGTPSPYLVFINYYFGAALVQLYQLMPGVRWYPVVFVSLHILSVFVIVNHILFKSRALALHRVALMGLVLAIALMLLIRVQFTTTTALTLVAGMLLVLQRRVWAWGLGGMMIVLAFMLRFEAAALALLIFSPFVAARVLQSPQRVGQLTSFVLAGITALGLHLAGDRAYQSLDRVYFDYNELRGRLNDNPNTKDPAIVLPDGIERNDFDLLGVFFQDGRVIDLETARQLLSAVENIEQQTFSLHSGKVKSLIFNHPFGMSGAAIVLLALLMLGRRQDQLLLLASVALMLGCFAYITNLALLKDRVIVTGLLPVFVMIALMGPLRPLRLGQGALYAAVLAGALVFGHDAFRKAQYNQARHALYKEQLDVIQSSDRQVLAYGADFQPQGNLLFGGFEVLEPRKVAYAGWMVNHPENRRFSTHDVLLSGDVALLIKTKGMRANLSRILQSLRKNYGVEAMTVIFAERSEFVLLGFVPKP